MNIHSTQELSKIFQAIADPTRQKILFLLRQQDELSVGDIAQRVEISQPAASQHIRVLKEAGTIVPRKAGQYTYYRLCSTRLYNAITDFVKVYQAEVAKS